MKVIYFYHIPKTGGSSIKNNLINLSKHLNGEYIHMYKKPIKVCTICSKLHCKMSIYTNKERNDNLINILKNINKDINKKYIIIHHHHGYCGLKDIKQDILDLRNRIEENGGTFYMFACIRDNISYNISRVNYISNNITNKKNVNFCDFIEDKMQHNFQSKYLLYNRTIDENLSSNKKDIIDILELFDMIYLTKNIKDIYSDLKNVLQTDIKWDFSIRNISKKTKFPSKLEIDNLNDINSLDIWFYELVKKIFNTNTDER